MSGIGAIFQRDGALVPRDQASRMANSLAMYGRQYQKTSLNGSCGLAYTHFANTPEARFERQPITGSGGRYSLVFDGRIDNRDDLAHSLAITSEALASMADGTLCLRAWERWKLDTPSHLIGEFAVIVWDNQEATIHAFRDHFGLRALSFHINDSRIIIASAPKGVFSIGDIRPRIDEQKVADVLADFYHDASRSFYRDIERLPPAHVLSVSRETVRLQRYWQADIESDIRLNNDDDYVEAGRELLNQAVKAQLRSAGPVGASLSGGLDSSSVAVTALDHLNRDVRLRTWTAVPSGDWDGRVAADTLGDERGLVEAMARQYEQLDARFVETPDSRFDQNRQKLFLTSETVTRSPVPSLAGHRIQEMASDEGITTLLDGNMGNMTLTWTGSGVLHDLLRRGQLRRLVVELAAMSPNPYQFVRKAWGKLALPMLPDNVWETYMRHIEKSQHRQRWKRTSAISDEFAREFDIEDRAKGFGYNFGGRPETNSRRLRLSVITDDCALETGDLAQGYRALYGIESRSPLMDLRLVEWCLKVPERQYQRNGEQRWLIRRMMKDRLPADVLENRKIGLIAADWHNKLSNDLGRMQGELATLQETPATRRMLDYDRLKSLMENWPTKTPVHSNADDGLYLRRVLPHALEAGAFVRWVEGSN